MSELMKVDGIKFSQSFESASLCLWCVPCGFTHTFDPEQVEMLVYALADRLNQSEEPEGLDPLRGGGVRQDCLMANLERTGPETQSSVLRNVQRREAE